MILVANRVNFFISSIIYWFLVMMLFYVFRYFGLQDENAISVNPIVAERTSDWFLVTGVGGILIGSFYFLAGVVTELPYFKRKSFGFIILLQVTLYAALLLFIAVTINNLITATFNIELVDGPIYTYRVFWVFVAYFTLFSFIFSFYRMVNEKFGKGVLLKILSGSYRTPKEEDRIFMFIDLKSSTRLAEKLGHFNYSRLIQQCFYDLNEVVFKHGGEIYQYVGDEVVISWPYKKGIANNQCIKCFIDFQTQLQLKESVYKKKFGVLPVFKAGLHGGKLVVTEVGVVKKEIAYHGDVINTTARIQAECNTFGEKLLISKTLLKNLKSNDLNTKPLGQINLKGKSELVDVYAVEV
ncbi:MAG: adenylate/guanylate cyclase domain-containing protein [bacterium]|nr:adenylate/guanylate cyclase domain-containing protein [bacterium]